MKRIRVGFLSANLNSGNMGCNALTYSAISLFLHAAEKMGVLIEFVLFSDGQWAPEFYPEFSDVNMKSVVPIVTRREVIRSIYRKGIRSISRYKADIESCDCFFEIAGGDSFSDIYGIRRPRYFNRLHRKIKKLGKPLVFLPQTIGPFKSDESKRLAESSLTIAKYVFARDPISYEVAAKICGNGKVVQTIDMAFFMDYKKNNNKNSKRVIGINPSGLLWSGGYTGNNQFGLKADYRETLCKIIESINPDIFDVVLVPHVLHGPQYRIEDDYKVCRILKDRYPWCTVAPFFYTPTEAKSYISGLDLMVGSRMHCCIAAYSSGVPIYPLAYSRKFKGLFKDELGYPLGAELCEEQHSKIMEDFQLVLDNLNDVQNEMSDRRLTIHKYGLELNNKIMGILGEAISG